MENIVEKMFIAIGLDTKAVDDGMNKLEDNLRAGFGGIMRSVVAPAIAAMGAFSAGDLVQQIGDEAIAIQRYAELLGMSTEQMGAWANAADRFGVGADDLVDVLTDVNDKVTDVVNNDAGPFKELIDNGLIQSFRHADGTLKTTEEIIYELSDVVRSLGGQAGGGLLKRLGFNDPRMLSMMMQGGDALRGLVEQMKEQGTYTDADAELAKEFNRALTDMTHTLKMLLLPVFRVLSPLMVQLARGAQFVADHFAALVPAIIAVAAVMVARMIPAAIKTGKAIMAAFSWKRFGLAAAIVALGLLLDDFITWLNGGESALGGFYDSLFGGVEGAKAFIDELSQFAEVAVWIGGAIAALWGLSQVITIVQGAFEAMTAIMATSFGPVGLAITAVIGALWLLYQNWDTVTKAAAAAWQWLCDILLGAWTAVTSTIDAWIANFQSMWAGIQNGLAEAAAFFGLGDASASLSLTGGGSPNISNAATQNNTINVYGKADESTINAASGAAEGWFDGGGIVGNSNY